MFSRLSIALLILALAVVVTAGGLFLFGPLGFDTETTEHVDYHPPANQPEDEVLVDDRLDDKQPRFDPSLVDRRPLGAKGEWLLNASAAVIGLDVPLIKPDIEPELLTLHPSYAGAVKSRPADHSILPSVNLLDGKAKQFDDGLHAALDQAYYRGLEGRLRGHVDLVRRLFDKAGKDSPAAPYLAAGLELADVHVEPADSARKQQWLAAFQANPVLSKPIGVYTWNDTLAACFRFLRFFQQPFEDRDLPAAAALANVLANDSALLADYQKALTFYSRLTNPLHSLSVADLVGHNITTPAQLGELAREKNRAKAAVALFPASTSRESVLFEKLFPLGLPPDTNLMRELVRRIRSGEVDLRPQPNSGWYDHQVYALETLLLPEKGEEKNKLLLTRAYKKRMLEAFQALLTKRRETHVRQLYMAEAKSAKAPPDKVQPRLRVEPCPSYFLRTARAYGFLGNFLEAALGAPVLQQLHGLTKDGARSPSLLEELHSMRDLFYGLYLVSAEDIGLKPALAADEIIDQNRCYKLAGDWLTKAFQDPDLATDTRVAVPVYWDSAQKTTRVWITLGVRLARLEATYARPPHLKPAEGGQEWKAVETYRLGSSSYLIPVDEFAEVELAGLRVLTREELRAVCDRAKTKAAILEELRN
jgi:hypothetical protein